MRSIIESDGREPGSLSFIEAARRAQIIDAAVETIARVGYGRASLAEIAKHAKISKSIISYHFENKDDLVMHVVEHIFAAGAAYMIPEVHAQTNARDALRAYVTSNVHFMRTHRNHMIAMVEIVGGFRDADGAYRLSPEDGAPAEAALAELLRWGQQSGDFAEFSPEVMAFTIRSTIDALPVRMKSHDDLDLDAYANELADVFDHATRRAGKRSKGART